MRRTGQHAVEATFHPSCERPRDVLARGEPISSVAVFPGQDCPPVSVLLEASGSEDYDGSVRLELAVQPHETRRLPRGVEFELQAGHEVLGRGSILPELNIFESIRQVTSRQEPFHSQFVCDALSASLHRGRSLFEDVWKLLAPADWSVPAAAEVKAEAKLRDSRRIDVLIRDVTNDRAIGMEVKTVDASVRSDQLAKYWHDLCRSFGGQNSVALAFLTPFNEASLEEEPRVPKAVQAFREFSEQLAAREGNAFANAHLRHISWLDLAAIPWTNGALWEQHREYVFKHISGPQARNVSTGAPGTRTFEHFFGEQATGAFWSAMGEVGVARSVNGVTLEVQDFDCRGLGLALKRAVGELTKQSPFVSREVHKQSKFEHRSRFLDSPYGQLHHALFELDTAPCIWVQGKENYGLRVAHENYPSGVSLVTSKGAGRLDIGRPR